MGESRSNTRFDRNSTRFGFIPRHFALGFSKPRAKSRGMKPNVVQLRSKRVLFRLSPRSGRKSKKHPWDRNSTRFGFIPQFWVGFSRAKSRVGRTSSNCVQNAFFDFPAIRANSKQHPWDRIPLGRFHTTDLEWPFPSQGKKPGWRTSSNSVPNDVFSTFNPGLFALLGKAQSKFWVGFSKQGKKPGWRIDRPIAFKTRCFDFAPIGAKVEKTPLGSQFH